MKINVLVGALVAVAAVGGIYYGSSMAPKASDMTSPDEDSQVALASLPASEDKPGTFTGTFADLMKRSGDWKCVVDSSTTAGTQSTSAGVVYVSNKKVRADFTTTVSGFGSIKTSMISDSEYVWSWSSMSPAGIKAKAVGTAGASTASASISGSAADANQAYSYDCQPSSVDASLFTLPAGVNFTEVIQ